LLKSRVTSQHVSNVLNRTKNSKTVKSDLCKISKIGKLSPIL
jgi:hypothetical protein